ncbi:hypothetical protein JQN63_11900 [Delftia lacustris]|uniref:hypothetical protein n=1 Tax=Delftia lacustris TaxID=558537 RepID=UPI00193AFE49|nr:hypothetical protein [Delftia lacustris]QRI92595.1 hypothetical protein JQN63_11900 [Delftia lacustris]
MERSIQRPGRLAAGAFFLTTIAQAPLATTETGTKTSLFSIPEKSTGLFENDSCLRV